MLRVCTKYAKVLDESMACNAEPPIEHLMERLNLTTDGNATAYVANAFASKKARYTALQWQDMVTQRTAWLKKTRPRDFITLTHKCCDLHDSATTCVASQANLAKARFIEGARANVAKFPTPLCTDSVAGTKLLLATTGPIKMLGNLDKSFNVTDFLTKDCDAATKQAILSMVKAPPRTIGMGRPVALTGLEILWRLHIVLGHASIDQVMATLSKTEGMRAGVVTKSDVEAFVKLGCAQCIVWKMRRAPVKSLVDSTLAPPGKKWSYDSSRSRPRQETCTSRASIQLSRRPCPVRRCRRSLTTSSTTSLQWRTPIRPRLSSCSCMPGIVVLAKSAITCADTLRVWRT